MQRSISFVLFFLALFVIGCAVEQPTTYKIQINGTVIDSNAVPAAQMQAEACVELTFAEQKSVKTVCDPITTDDAGKYSVLVSQNGNSGDELQRTVAYVKYRGVQIPGTLESKINFAATEQNDGSILLQGEAKVLVQLNLSYSDLASADLVTFENVEYEGRLVDVDSYWQMCAMTKFPIVVGYMSKRAEKGAWTAVAEEGVGIYTLWQDGVEVLTSLTCARVVKTEEVAVPATLTEAIDQGMGFVALRSLGDVEIPLLAISAEDKNRTRWNDEFAATLYRVTVPQTALKFCQHFGFQNAVAASTWNWDGLVYATETVLKVIGSGVYEAQEGKVTVNDKNYGHINFESVRCASRIN